MMVTVCQNRFTPIALNAKGRPHMRTSVSAGWQDEAEFNKQQSAELAAMQKRLLVLFHAWVQVRDSGTHVVRCSCSPAPHLSSACSRCPMHVPAWCELCMAMPASLIMVPACVQAMLAVGLLQLRPWKPRFVGFLGTMASAINCYMLFPALPAPAKKPTPAVVKADEAVCSAKKELAKVA